MFLDRHPELALLERTHREAGARLVIVYGRRRVGKTELLREFCRHRRSAFFVADQRPSALQLRDFSTLLWRAAGEDERTAPAFAGWGDAFSFAGRLARRRRLALVIDEFPYLAWSDRSLPSVLQRVWDSELARTRLFLILCGSSVSYMEGELLAQKSPLFGRRSRTLRLEPMDLPDAAGFWRGIAPEDAVRAYAAFGGVPAYARRFVPERSLAANLKGEVLDKDAYLFDEVPYLLVQELREPRVYLALLQALAAGKTTQNEAAQAAGLRGNQAAPYLKTLMELRLVEREVPLEDRHPEKSRKGSYRVRDPFLRFWFRFVLPNRSRLEQGLTDAVWTDHVEPRLDEHVSLVFEDLAMAHLWRLARAGALPRTPARIASWRGTLGEIDLVAHAPDHGWGMVAECKWSARPVGLSVLRDLEARGALAAGALGFGDTHYALFSRSGFTADLRREARRRGVLLVSPRELVRGR